VSWKIFMARLDNTTAFEYQAFLTSRPPLPQPCTTLQLFHFHSLCLQLLHWTCTTQTCCWIYFCGLCALIWGQSPWLVSCVLGSYCCVMRYEWYTNWEFVVGPQVWLFDVFIEVHRINTTYIYIISLGSLYLLQPAKFPWPLHKACWW
jgi:hypothetical protein